MKRNIPLKLIGTLWIILGPLGVLQALISTVESVTFYRLQLAVFALTGALSVIAGIGMWFLCRWASRVLRAMSWLTFAYYMGSGLLMVLAILIPHANRTANETVLVLFVSIFVMATGVPFFFLARYLGSNRVKQAVFSQKKVAKD